MTAVTFDTHKFIRTLRDVGVEEKQAEAFSDAFKDAQGEAELAIKADLREMEHRIKADIIKWIVGLLIAQTALLVALFDRMK